MTAAFARLGLAPTREARAIKRAYAVALKAIDQGSEREAFERLRQAYEQALAWAAQADDKRETEEEQEDEQKDERGEQGEPEIVSHFAPVAPPVDPRRMDELFPPFPPAPPLPAPDEARQAVRHWTDQLRNAPPEAVADVFDAALADPRLLHLDSHAQLEARVADLLHDDPTGRAALFDTAALHFHWTDRNARPVASAAAAQWISRVINQDLQWQAQGPAVTSLQKQALDAAARVASPGPAQAHLASALDDMAREFPDWFALHLAAQGHAHLPAWLAFHARLASRRAVHIERQQRYFGTRGKTVRTLLGGFVVLMLAGAVLSGVMSRLTGSFVPAVVAVPESTISAARDAVLAYEITGAVTRDSCESTEEFVHESNWLQVGDGDAVALLATRAMRCQDKGLWSRKDDALMACLRAERAAALAAGRPEDAPRCLPSGPQAAGQKPDAARPENRVSQQKEGR